MRLRPARLLSLVLALTLVAGACGEDDAPTVIVSGQDPATAPMNVVETLEAEGYTILVSLIEEAGLTERLSDPDASYTLFAPSDTAFADLDPGLVEVFSGEEDVLVVPESTGDAASQGPAPGEAETGDEGEDAEGDDAEDGATTTTSLAPRPSPGEIEGLLRDILLHHVVDDTFLSTELLEEDALTSVEGTRLEIGQREMEPVLEGGEPQIVPTVNRVELSGEGLRATNGVIHTIDQVLIPEDRGDDVEQLVASIPVATDVLATLRASAEHERLVSSLEASGLAEDLATAEGITVFAPTDAAFDALTQQQRDLLLDQTLLAIVLEYHIIDRTIMTSDVLNQEAAQTRQGEPLLLVAEDGELIVEDAEIEYSVQATNGVVHVVDEFLVPDEATGPGGF